MDRSDLLRQCSCGAARCPDTGLADLAAASRGKRVWVYRHLNTHVQSKDTQIHTHRASELSYSAGALICSDQTPRVMGMFSGCYLVLCGNEIASHLYHHPQTLEGPLTITGTRTTRLPGDTNQLAA